MRNGKIESENVVLRLISSYGNRQLLTAIPNHSILDLSYVYYCTKEERYVTHTDMNELQMSEEHLFKLAVKNTLRLFPTRINCMLDVVLNAVVGKGTDLLPTREPEYEKEGAYILSNKTGEYGSVNLFVDGVIESYSQKWNTSFYILPSSCHEVILFASSTDKFSPEYTKGLSAMVMDVNKEQVRLDERLSNQVYFFDKKTKKITQITDNPQGLNYINKIVLNGGL